MKRFLQCLLGLEILIGAAWTLMIALSSRADGFGLVGLFFLVYAVFAVMFLIAAIAWWFFQPGRRLSVWIMLLPVLFWFLPMGLQGFYEGPISLDGIGALLGILVGIGFIACWIAPRKAAALMPSRLVGSRVFNGLIVGAMIAGWVVLIAGGLFVASSGRPTSSTANPGWALAYGVVFAALYLVALGLVCFGASTWAWICLRGGLPAAPRKLNIAQLVVAAPGILAAAVAVLWFGSQS